MIAAVTPIATPPIEWAALLPTLVLIGGSLLMLATSALSRRRPFKGAYATSTVVIAVIAMIAAVPLWRDVTDRGKGPYTAVAGAIGVDGFSVFLTFVILAGVVLAALLADGFLRREGIDGVELYVLMLLSASGGLVMASANDLIVLFLGLEILSISVYVLAAMHLRKPQSQEAGVKYFVLGAFSSAFFLYGIALVYGATGTTNLTRIAAYVPAQPFAASVTPDQLITKTPALLLAGFALLLVGFGFKAAVAPFHSWAPDVYQGAPTPTVVFMASAVKAAAFAGLLRVFTVAFSSYRADWQPYVYALAVATLLVGAVLAVVQSDVKRMLAYSSINHAGFILLGVVAADKGVSGALFYLGAYTFMVAGSFGVVTVVSRRGDAATTLDDYNGLAKREPLLAFAFTIFLLAQAGVPLTSGFFAKFYVLQSAIDAGYWHLALVAMLSAVISAFLYLRIVVAMYMADDPEAEGAVETPAVARRVEVPLGAKLALAVAFVATVLIGFLPGPLADSSKDATPAATAAGTQSK
ncbi:MAG: NADH-quinone oxidoreductase subunit N [Acidimicrobiales bacterium]